jgi:hypothetical protein
VHFRIPVPTRTVQVQYTRLTLVRARTTSSATMSPRIDTPHVLVLSTTRHALRATLITTDLHVVGGHTVAWREHEVEREVKPEQEGDDTTDSAGVGGVSGASPSVVWPCALSGLSQGLVASRCS